jgi:hypothetical protein
MAISTAELMAQENAPVKTADLMAMDKGQPAIDLKPEPLPWDIDKYVNDSFVNLDNQGENPSTGMAAVGQFFAKPWVDMGYSTAAALNRGMAYFSTHLDTISEYIGQKTGTEPGGVFKSAAKTYEQNTTYWQQRAKENGISFLPELFGEALGGSVPGIAEFVLNIPYASLLGAAEANKKDQNEVAGALVEGAKRGVLGLMFRAIEPLKQYLRAPLMGGIFAGQTAAEGGDTKEIAKSFGTGALYSALSPGGAYGLKEVKENLTKKIVMDQVETPAIETPSTVMPEQKPMEPETAKELDTNFKEAGLYFDAITARREAAAKEAASPVPQGEGKSFTPELKADYAKQAAEIKAKVAGEDPLTLEARKYKSAEEFEDALPESDITKSQLTDIWNKANEGKQTETAAFAPEKNFRREPGIEQPTDEITRRSDLVRFLNEKLDIPIRTGRFQDKALGIFKLKDEVIRTKQANDIEVIAHEIGHGLQKFLYPEEKTQKGLSAMPFSEFKNELDPMATKPKAGQETTPEGFAEFVRLYITNPKQAKEKAPGFYDHFEHLLKEKTPETLDILKDASKQYDRWLKQPALQRVLSQVSVGVKEKREFSWDKLYTATIDDLHPLKQIVDEMAPNKLKVSEDPYKLARLMRGIEGKGEAFLDHSPFKFKTYEDIGKSLKDILAPLKDNLDEFRAYILSKASLKLEGGFMAPGGRTAKIETGILKNDAEHIVKDYEKQFKQPFQEIKDFQDHVLNYLFDSGMINKETYTKMKANNEDYVPMYRVFEEKKIGKGGGVGLEARNPIKKKTGSWRDIQDPLESVIKNTYLYINAAEKNAVGQSLINLAEKDGMGKFVEKIPKPTKGTKIKPEELFSKDELAQMEEAGIEPQEFYTIFRPSAFTPKDNVISVWKDGEQNLYQVHPDIAKVFQALDRENSNMLMRILSEPASWLRVGATLTPEFIGRNPIRDQMSAFVYSKYGFIPGWDFAKGVFSMAKKDQMYWDWKKGGADHSMLVSMDRNYLQDKLGDLLQGYPVMNLVKNPIEALRILSELGEAGTRIGEFRKGIQTEGATKAGIQESAFSAREVTLDFNRKGATGKAVNTIIAFWNANMQGTDKMIRAFKDNPVSTSLKVAAAMTLPSVLLAIASHDDPRIKEIPAWERDMFWCIPTDNHIWRIPKPFELGIIFGSVPERITHYILDQDPHSFDKILNSVWQGLAPGFVPSAAIPIMENWANKSTYFNRPIVPSNRTELLPEYQYSPYTTETAKELGKILGKLPWVDQLMPTSPAYIENLVRGWTGGLGVYALQIADKGLEAAGITQTDYEKPASTLSDIPFIKAFHSRFPSSNAESIQQFYESYKEIDQTLKTVKTLIGRENKPEEAIRLMEAGNMENLTGHFQSLRNIHSVIDAIYINPSMTGDEKREFIDTLYMQMMEIAKNGNTVLDMMKEQKKEMQNVLDKSYTREAVAQPVIKSFITPQSNPPAQSSAPPQF